MSEYQDNYKQIQSKHTTDSYQSDFVDNYKISDNRSQAVAQKIVQKKLDQFQTIQSSNLVQRAGGMEDEELPVQGKSITIQKEGNPEEEEPIQGKFENYSAVAQMEAVNIKPNNTGLPDNLKSGVENLSGLSLDNVQVHYNSDKPTQLQALAYTQGNDIHVASGQEKHLPHEAWHVVQQMQGRVQPTIEMNGGVQVNDDAGLENEADIMGQKAL